jgi:pimeloyl-ACP methyl ester carboxylesterase
VKRAGFLAGAAAAVLARPAAAAVAAGPESAYDLATPAGAISGSLLLPASSARPPVVLIVAGSGPTDRDGNGPGGLGTNAYRLLAEALAGRGIASLRYDKRGVGKSAAVAPSEESVRFDDMIGDAAAWLAALHADGRFGRVAVAGHSEGSLIGMVAAKRAPADAFISLAGAGFPAGEVLRRQIEPEALPPQLKATVDAIIDRLEAGATVTDVPLPLLDLFRASVQPYLISWFRYDPRVEIAKLAIPCTLVQGTNDVQISVADARSLAAAQPRAKLVLIDGMTHVLKDAPLEAAAEQVRTVYANPSLPLDAVLVETVAAAANGRK